MPYPAYESLALADTESVPPLPYMAIDRVARTCRKHRPLALFQVPPAGDTVLQLRFIMISKYAVCATCGATALYRGTRLRWGDIDNLKTKANAVQFNRDVRAAALASAGKEGISGPQ